MIRMLKDSFDAVYPILEASFPPDERRPKAEQEALFSRDEYQLWGMVEDGKLCGFAAVWELGEIAFLEHLAVEASHRNRGLGAKMLSELSRVVKGRLVLEVELPETELAKRRIGFYERCGFCYNDFDYTQPPISKGKSPIPLRVMSYGEELTKAEFTRVRDTLYERVYGIK